MVADEQSVGAALARIAAVRGAAPAIRTLDRVVTYEELDRTSAAIARWLVAQGHGRGKSTVLIASGVDYILTYFGIVRAGNRAVPIEPRFRGEQLRRIVASTGVSLAIVDAQGREAFASLDEAPPLLDVDTVVTEGSTSTSGPLPDVSRDTELCVLFSSGSTGFPKGVILTHAAGLGRAALMTRVYGAGKRHLVFTPLVYAYGLIDGTLAPLLHGGETLLLGSYNPTRFKEMVTKLQPQIVLGVPFLYKHLGSMGIDLLAGLAEVKNCLYYTTGEPLPRAVATTFEARYGVPIRQNYGLSEISALAADLHDAPPVPSRVGKIIPGVEVTFVSDQGEVDVEMGELWVKRSPLFMKGYVEGTEVVEGRMTAEYYKTGDIGRVDKDGYLELMGRNDDFVSVGGVRIHPAETENVLLAIPGVLEAAFVVERDLDTGNQSTRAYVVLDPTHGPTAAELDRRVKAELPPSRWPQHIEISAGLPRTDTGKLVRRRLVERQDERLVATAEIIVELPAARLEGMLLDVSRNGCMIEVYAEITSGTPARISLRTDHALTLEGVLRHVVTEGDAFRAGVSFTSTDKALIERFIAAR